jgi:hypothetical protein
VTAKKAASLAKHVASAKHKVTSKHSETAKQKAARSASAKKAAVTRAANKKKVTAKGKAVTHAKATTKVAFAVGDWLPVCGFEALAQSLRLAGQPVHGDEVAELWELAGAAEATSVEDALAAAARFGLAGCRPVQQRHVGPVDTEALRGKVRVAIGKCGIDLREHLIEPVPDLSVHGLILQIDVPGPHAVLATVDGWWSWGELFSPWPATIEAAWAVSWS